MNDSGRLAVIVPVLLFVLASPGGATDYYVDFDTGSDWAAGTSTAAAWKHAPGDPAAEGVPAATVLQGGDEVVFRGGVVYRGNIVINAAGDPGAPIVYRGDGWGSEQAIVDGSEPVAGPWQPCPSQAECGGNPSWQNIYSAFLPSGVSPFTANLHQDGAWLWTAQEPDQPDPFYYDSFANYWSIPPTAITRTTITDPDHLAGLDPDGLEYAHVLVWHIPNLVTRSKITGYDPAGTITFEDMGGDPYNDRDGYYSLDNCSLALDQPGEYVVADEPEPNGSFKVWLWPHGAGPIEESLIEVSVREFGFHITEHDHVTVQGFEIRRFASANLFDAVGIKSVSYIEKAGITVRDNFITHNRHVESGYGGIYLGGCSQCTVEGNTVFENPANAGIFAPDCLDTVVRNNLVQRVGSTAIRLYGTIDSEVSGNLVVDVRGTHANGLTFYLYCDNILIDGNTVIDSNIALTIEHASNLTIRNNVLHGGGQNRVLAGWGSDFNNIEIYNNDLLEAGSNAALGILGGTNITIRNNIIDGLLEGDPQVPYDMDHNLFTGTAWNQRPLGATDIYEEDLEVLFRDPDGFDFHLISTSPAVDAGAVVPVDADLEGTPRPLGPAWDLGAYELAVLFADGFESGDTTRWTAASP